MMHHSAQTKHGWSDADRFKYILGILRNRLDMGPDMVRGMSYHVKNAHDNGLSWDVIEDEAKMAIQYSEFRCRLLDLTQ